MIKAYREYLLLSTETDQTFTVEYYPVPDKFAAVYRCPITLVDVHMDFNDDELEVGIASGNFVIIGEV